jgi:hypothetical protein
VKARVYLDASATKGCLLPSCPKSKARQSKGKAVPVDAMKAYKESRVIAPVILNLGTRWRWLLAARCDRFTPAERAHGTHWIRSRVGSRVDLDALEKRNVSCPPGIERNPIRRTIHIAYKLNVKTVKSEIQLCYVHTNQELKAIKWLQVLWEPAVKKLIVPQRAKKFSDLRETWVFIVVFTRAGQWTLRCAKWLIPQHYTKCP